MASEVADLYVTLRTKAEPLLAGFEEAGTQGESFIKKMGGVSGALSKLGGATVAAGIGVSVASVKMAGDFQQETNVLVTAAGEAAGNLGKVRSGILQIAKDTGTSWQQLTEGMYVAEKAGFNFAKGGLDVVKVAAEGAREEGAPLNDVVDAMTTVMNNYHLPASKAVQVMNAMKTAAGEAKTNFGLFSASLSTVLPAAYSAHISFSDIAGSIAAMTQKGETAQHATQLLNSTIRSLLSPNAQAVSTLNQLGLTTQQVAKDMGKKGLSGTLDEITAAIQKHMGPAGTYAVSVFKQSAQAASSVKTMFASLPKDIQSSAKAFMDGKMNMQDWNEYLQGLPATEQPLAKQFGNLVLKSHGFSDALKNGNGAVTTFNDLLRKATGTASGMQTALLLTGNKGKDTAASIAKVNKSFHDGSKDVEGWGSTSKLFNVQLAKLKQSAEVLAIQWGTKLIPVLTASVGWFSKHTGTAKVFAGIIAGILTLAVLTWSGKTALSMVRSVKDIGSALGGGVKAVRAFAAAGGGLDGIRLRASYAKDALVSMGTQAKAGAKLMAGQVASGAKAGASALASLANGAKAAGIWIADMSKKLVLQAATLAKNAALWVANKVATLAAAAASKIAAAAQWLLDVAMDANPLALIVIAIVAVIAGLVLLYVKCKWFRDFINALGKDIAAFGVWIWQKGLKPAFDAIATGAEWVARMVVKYFEFWMSLPGKVIGWFKSLYNGALNILGRFVSWVGGLPGKILGYWKGVGKWLYNTGWNLIVGLWNGINGMVGKLYNYVAKIGSNIVGYFGKALGIASPSKVFAQQGQYIGQGLLLGMQSMSGHVTDQARALAKAAVSGFGSPTLEMSATGAAATTGATAAAGALAVGGQTTGTGAGLQVQQPIYATLDGQVLFKVLVTLAQQHGLRNRSTNMQLSGLFGGAPA